jgi:hypothetical protein
MLNDIDDGELLVQKSLRSFVRLLWKRYQKNIKKYAFFPFLGYLFSIQALSILSHT